MIALLKTAERTNNTSSINNYVYQRHVFAYKAVPLSYISGKQVLELGCAFFQSYPVSPAIHLIP